MLAFQEYQRAFTAHIRDPATHKKPAKVNAERMAVYRYAVFKNIVESVSACFPVCQKILGKRAWNQLMRSFVMHHASTSPIFREMPKQFLDYLKTVHDVPPYFFALAHYEWVELAVSAIATKPPSVSKKCNLLDETPVITPASRLLQYDYPVHKISVRNKPKAPETTHLLVFRNNINEVKFIELNPMTYQLLSSIQEQNLTGKQALTRLAAHLNHANTDAIVDFGAKILSDLMNQDAIMGSVKAPA